MSESTVKVREHEAELVVQRRRRVADDVVELTLADGQGRELAEWRPGAHIDLQLGDSLVRQYSLCSSPRERAEWRIAVLRDPAGRGGSQHVHEHLHEGAVVRVRGPRNHFPLVSAPRYEFIAGGIGITPILPMIESVKAAGAEWRLLYGGRRRDSMAYVDHLAEHGHPVTVCPQEEQGVLDLDSVLGPPRDDTAVYCCGPEPLLDAVEERCAATWPPGSLHVERFAAKTPADEPPTDAPESFEVVCQRSGITVSVPAGTSIYDAVEEAGVDVMGSCMEGICGTCEAAVVEGTPDHRDSLLTNAQRETSDVMYICVSRSRSETLVLDL